MVLEAIYDSILMNLWCSKKKKKKNSYGRDSVEPAIKPGKAALVSAISLCFMQFFYFFLMITLSILQVIISGVTWLLQQFPQLADRL